MLTRTPVPTLGKIAGVFVLISGALTVCADAFRYSFDSYPRFDSSGSLSGGALTFYSEPHVEPSPFDMNGAENEDWALGLDRNLKQYSGTDECQSFTNFNGSYRVELFFRSNGLSD